MMRTTKSLVVVGITFLGFMFGNVDDSGDLDANYLDEV